jgi:hypothetical protein
MVNPKPSELPLYTIIEFEDEDFIRLDAYYGTHWQTLRCVDCGAGSEFTDSEADVKFKEFKILALPVATKPNPGEN